MMLTDKPTAYPAPRNDDPIKRAVVVATRRLRQRRALRWGANGFLAGSVVGFVTAVAIGMNLLREATLPGGGAFLFLPTLTGLMIGTFYGVVGKYDPIAVARLLEHRLDLKDRLSTALSTKRDGSAVRDAQYSDALSHTPDESAVYSAVPLTPVPRRVYIAGAVALAVALAYFAPAIPVFWSGTRRAEQVAVKKEGERLLAVAKAAAEEAKKQDLPEAEKAARKVEQLGKEMARGRMPLREALMERAKLSEELRKAQSKIAQEKANSAEKQSRTDLTNAGRDAVKKLQNSNATAGSNPAPNTPDGRMKALQDALSRGDESGAAQVLREMADAADRGEPAPGAERNKSAEQLSAIGDALNKNNLANAGRSAEKASDAMRKNAMPDAARSLREAADAVEQGAGNAPAETPSKTASEPQQNQSSPGASSGQAAQQNPLEKMLNSVQNTGGASPAQNGNQTSQQGQSSAPQSAQSGSPEQKKQGNGSQGAPPQGSPPGGQTPGGSSLQKSQSQSGQPGAGNRPGQGNSPGNKPGEGGTPGQGKKSGSSGGKPGGGGKGSGDDTTGSAKSGDAAGRLGKGAREQNVRGKQSGEGPETVITENDTQTTALPASALPYYKEFVKRRNGPASESAQTRDAVPNAYRNQVRGYFDSLPSAAKSGAKGQ